MTRGSRDRDREHEHERDHSRGRNRDRERSRSLSRSRDRERNLSHHRSSRRERDHSHHRSSPRKHKLDEDELQEILWERDFNSNKLATNLNEVQWNPGVAAIGPKAVTLPVKNESNVRYSRPDGDKPWKLGYIGQNDVNWCAADRSRPGNYNMSIIAEPKALQAALATISDLAHMSGKGHCIINFQLQDIRPGPFSRRTSLAAQTPAKDTSSGFVPFKIPTSHNDPEIPADSGASTPIGPAPLPSLLQLPQNLDRESAAVISEHVTGGQGRTDVKNETSPDLDIIKVVEGRHGLDRRRSKNNEPKELKRERSPREPGELVRGDIYDGSARRIPDDVYPDRLSIRYHPNRDEESDVHSSPAKDKDRPSRSRSPRIYSSSRSPPRGHRSGSKSDRREKRDHEKRDHEKRDREKRDRDKSSRRDRHRK